MWGAVWGAAGCQCRVGSAEAADGFGLYKEQVRVKIVL